MAQIEERLVQIILYTCLAGFCPVIFESLSATSSSFFLSLIEPTPAETTTFEILGACITFLYPKSPFRTPYDFLILSHTVNPEEDSSRILLRYAEQHNAVDKNWIFLTGDKKQLYNLARKGYLLNAEAGKGDADDFIHTQNFALIDKEKHIRGFYDGTDSLEIERLITEIKVLMDEYEFKKNNN